MNLKYVRWCYSKYLSRFCRVFFFFGFRFVDQADINKLITRKFKQRPATQAEMRDCSAVIGRDQLAQARFYCCTHVRSFVRSNTAQRLLFVCVS